MVTPERNFAESFCKLGPKCSFSHDPTTLCYSFQTPKGCPKGASCVFSQRPTSSVAEASAGRRNNRGASTVAEQDYEVRFRQWTYLIPKQNLGRCLHHGPPDVKTFFKAGWELMASSDASGCQKLIKKLSTDEGLNMIKTLAETMDSDQQDRAILATFEGSVTFFYRTISHAHGNNIKALSHPHRNLQAPYRSTGWADAIGALRDAVRREAEHLEQIPLPAAQARQRQLERAHFHANLGLRRWELDRRKGIQLVAEFDQPTTITNLGVQHRRERWDSSRRLQPSSLVCLVSSTGQNIFCLVCDPKPTAPSKNKHRENSDDEDEVSSVAELEYRWKMAEMPSLYQDGSRAAVMLTLIQGDCRHIAWISQLFTERDSTVKISPVEFPGLLLPSFQPTLEALQQMSQRLDLPFTEHLAPEVPEQWAQVTAPPLLSAQRPFDWNAFDNITSLDEAKQAAVIHALNNSFALIQGPPGTGKSYTGVSIIKVLLRNREVGKLGPIICVCYTNHALDQLLEHLVLNGVEQVVRIGSRSKSELLKNVNLYDLAQQVAQSKYESHEKYILNQLLTSSMGEIASLSKELNALTSI
ncbi:MAG: hypothetical protein Q9178_006224 [Gyalolechia marmorata]